MKAIRLLLSAIIILVLGCNKGTDEASTESTEESVTVTEEQEESAAGPVAEPAEEATGEAEAAEPIVPEGPCPEGTEVVIHGTNREERYPNIDGPLMHGTEFADVTLGSSVELLFASYELTPDPQFGLSAPVGIPDVPEGGIVLVYAFKADAAAPHETCAHVQLVDQTRSLDALPSIEPTGAEREAATATGTDDATPDPTDGQPAHSAYSACRLPGTPVPAITCQDEVLGNTRRKERASRARVATCQGLSLPDNGAPGRIRTCNPRIRSPRLYPLSYGRKCLEYRTL